MVAHLLPKTRTRRKTTVNVADYVSDPAGNEERALEAGTVSFFQKPFDNEELLGVIRASLLGMGRTLADNLH